MLLEDDHFISVILIFLILIFKFPNLYVNLKFSIFLIFILIFIKEINFYFLNSNFNLINFNFDYHKKYFVNFLTISKFALIIKSINFFNQAYF